MQSKDYIGQLIFPYAVHEGFKGMRDTSEVSADVFTSPDLIPNKGPTSTLLNISSVAAELVGSHWRRQISVPCRKSNHDSSVV